MMIDNTVMPTLATAIQQRQRLKLHYVSWKDERTEQLFDPYDIVFHEGYWYIAGYCHLRQTPRTLRVDCIQQVELTEKVFARPTDFDAVAHVIKSLHNPPEVAPVEVLFMTSPEEAQRSIPPELGRLEAVDEGIMFRRSAYRLEWVASMLLNLDFPIQIIQPSILKDMIRELGEKALRIA
ncbi:MAG: WYL domain-containing protein [Blastochloris sp.]|nr:WYL domain-containing protein [Blastochloris sp.]